MTRCPRRFGRWFPAEVTLTGCGQANNSVGGELHTAATQRVLSHTLHVYPEDRVTVIVLSNNQSGSAGKINDVLSAITFGKPYEIPKERKAITVASSVLEKYVGEYQAQFPPTNYKITIENGKLMFQEIDFLKAEMFAESETDFFLKAADMRIKFIKDANGTVTGFIVDQGDGTLYPIMNGQKVK